MILMENAVTTGNLDQSMLNERNIAQKAANSNPCPSCEHDYETLCPKGWMLNVDGACTAPVSYKEPCVNTAFFNEMSPDAKAQFESRCLVCWPCLGAREMVPSPLNGP